MSVVLPFELPGFEILEARNAGNDITVAAVSTAQSACCSLCHTESAGIHSLYQRHPLDLPFQDRVFRLSLRLHRFFCRNRQCPRKIFVEPIPAIATRYARQTRQCATRLTQFGLALGGEAGARLARRSGLPVSGDTLLRILHHLSAPSQNHSRAIGIDDWAWRKGVRYGTIICDLERHSVLDLLPDSETQTVIGWLQARSGIEIVSRDRSSGFADAIRQGSPQARQVADRWHLLQNLREAVEEVVGSHRKLLVLRDPAPPAEMTSPAQGTLIDKSKRGQLRQDNRAQRLARYQLVIDLNDRGLSQVDIARQVGLDADTINRWLAAGSFPERKSVGSKALRPYLEYIHRRWGEGCHNASQIWREICALGYDRSRNAVLDYVARLRQGLATASPEYHVSASSPVRRYRPSEVAYLFTRSPDRLRPQQRDDLTQIRQSHPALDQAYFLAQAFSHMLKDRQATNLGPWLRSALACPLVPFRTFAMGLHRDRLAVEAAIALPWSNGQVEGQINRLKLIKRQMYGRASFPLLRVRVLYPP